MGLSSGRPASGALARPPSQPQAGQQEPGLTSLQVDVSSHAERLDRPKFTVACHRGYSARRSLGGGLFGPEDAASVFTGDAPLRETFVAPFNWPGQQQLLGVVVVAFASVVVVVASLCNLRREPAESEGNKNK